MFNVFKVANKTLVSKDKDNETGKEITHIHFNIPANKLYWNYAILYLCCLTFGMSGSSFPSIVKIIEKEFDIHEKRVGLLSTMHYIGSLLGGLFMIIAMKLNMRKRILISSALGNMVCTFAISTLSGYYSLFVARFFNGFFVVLTVIIIPVWVDQFIPTSKRSIFMAINHTQSVAGSIFGFIMTSNIAKTLGWRYSWLIQGSMIFVLFLLILPMDAILFSRTIKRIDDNGLFELNISEVSHEDRLSLNSNQSTGLESKATTESKDHMTPSKSNDLNTENVLNNKLKKEFNNQNNFEEQSNNTLGENLIDSDSDSNNSTANTLKEEQLELTNFQIFCMLIKNTVSVFIIIFLYFYLIYKRFLCSK